jgi:hypothetical protein
MHYVHFLLGVSHLCFLPVLYALIQETPVDVIGVLLVCMVIVWSTLMHVSETKKSLIPSTPWLRRNSMRFLNVDRFFAVVTTFYGFWRLSTDTSPELLAQRGQLVAEFVVLALISAVGELCGSRLRYGPYLVLHIIWHLGVANIAYRVVTLSMRP